MKQFGEISLDRMVRAVEKVRQRLERTTTALNAANIDYALIGGNAVAAWVSRIDGAAVRNTRDVDILLRREDLEKAIPVMEAAGFVYRHARGIDMFLDGPGGKVYDAIKIRHETDFVCIDNTVLFDNIYFLSLESLVHYELHSNHCENMMNLRDLIEANLIDETWPSRFEPPLNTRLQDLIDDPEG